MKYWTRLHMNTLYYANVLMVGSNEVIYIFCQCVRRARGSFKIYKIIIYKIMVIISITLEIEFSAINLFDYRGRCLTSEYAVIGRCLLPHTP